MTIISISVKTSLFLVLAISVPDIRNVIGKAWLMKFKWSTIALQDQMNISRKERWQSYNPWSKMVYDHNGTIVENDIRYSKRY